MKLLFVSNLFPDTAAPYRGLDNATLLHHLADRWQIRVLAVRPTLPLVPRTWRPRAMDAKFSVEYVAAPYLPRIGDRWNHRLMAGALRRRLRAWHAEGGFDVVLASWLFPDCCAVAELAREFNFPFIAIAQGSDAHQYLQIPTRRKIMTRLLPRASSIITRSAELARLLAEAGLPGEGLLHPIYNGVDLELFCPADRRAARRELGLPAEGPLILFVGNFFKIKNPLIPPLALAVLKAARAFSSPPILAMVGSGDSALAQHVRRMPDQLSLQKQVFFPGRLDSARVARYMQAADVLLLPSQNEGVPNVILEAFACGLPVVVSHVGGIPEVHPGEGFGRLVQDLQPGAFADALYEVLRAPPDPAGVRQHAVQQFSWSRTADTYHELLCKAVRR